MERGRVSVIIPSRNETFLAATVREALEKATGDVEVVAVLEGYWDKGLPEDKRLRIVHHGKPRGMRGAINSGVAASTGQFLLKLDAHCLLARGFDEELKAPHEEDWISVPRRYALDADKWERRRGRTPIDYQFLSFYRDVGGTSANAGDRGGPGLHGRNWDERNRDPALKQVLIDDLMSAQGSGYFLTRAYWDRLELLDEKNYGTFGSEFQEVGLKAWLGGGRVVRNKKTWYAHLHKGKKWGRGWPLGRHDADRATSYTLRWVDDAAWEHQERPFRWLIERFWPVPGWPEEWAP